MRRLPASIVVIAIMSLSIVSVALVASESPSAAYRVGNIEITGPASSGQTFKPMDKITIAVTVKNYGYKAPFEARLEIAGANGTVYNSRDAEGSPGRRLRLDRNAEAALSFTLDAPAEVGVYTYRLRIRNVYSGSWQLRRPEGNVWGPIFEVVAAPPVGQFQPVAIRTGEISATGYRFEPVAIRTGEISATGYRFEPVAIRTGEISATGYRFQPVVIRTGEISATGYRSEESPSNGAGRAFGVELAKMVLSTKNKITGDFAGQTIALKGDFAKGDVVVITFVDAQDKPWTFNVGENFSMEWAPAAFPFKISASGNMAVTSEGAAITFTMLKVSYIDAQSMDGYEFGATIQGPRNGKAQYKFLVTPGDEIETE